MAHLILLAMLALPSAGGDKPPVHMWYEPEWFPGVEGNFGYWTGKAKPTGKWGVAGPGISAEWSQGGESGWNSMGAAADETRAECGREIVIPQAGKYRVWVRYVEHRRKTAPFTVKVGENSHVFGAKPTLPSDDEYLLYWGFTFAWSSFDATLKEGKVPLKVIIDRKGEAWRQVDAILLTTDLDYEPHGREKPPFLAYQAARRERALLREPLPALPAERPAIAGRRFSLWAGVRADAKWWEKQKPESLRLVDVFHEHSPPTDIKAAFHKQYPRPDTTPLITSPHLVPGFYLGDSPDLSPGTALRKWLERTKVPFYIMTNYATGKYDNKTGPATYAALTGPLKQQFLGYVHGEAIGTVGLSIPEKAFGKTRAEQAEGMMKHLKADQAKRWSDIYKTKVDEAHWAKGIPCLSVDSTALAHLFYEMGSDVVGYEIDATMPNVPLRMAFLRGAARQYGKAWINYASGNFGDACNYFTQEPRVPRGAKSWYHSKYAITDGVTAGWYRALYYLNYTGGASAIYWEQSLENQWLLPGPGEHPVQLSPFGRGTEDFMEFLRSGPEPGEPITPIAILLSHAHGYEPTNYRCRMLHHFHESAADRELRELFNVCYSPVAEREGMPASPYTQSMTPGTFGNFFDVIVDRPTRIKAINNYAAVYAAGDVQLGPIKDELAKYVRQGGTLIVNVNALKGLPREFVGLEALGKRVRAEKWGGPDKAEGMKATPFEVEEVKLGTAEAVLMAGKVPLLARNKVGKGNVLVTLVPGMMGLDERAHPALVPVIRHLVQRLSPLEVRSSRQQVLYQINRTKSGLVVFLLNPNGVDKTQNGVARVDRRAATSCLLAGKQIDRAAVWADGKMVPLTIRRSADGLAGVTVPLGPGSLAVVKLTFKAAKPSP